MCSTDTAATTEYQHNTSNQGVEQEQAKGETSTILDDLNCTSAERKDFETFTICDSILWIIGHWQNLPSLCDYYMIITQTLQNITIYCDVHLSSSLCGFRVKYSSFSDPPARFEGSWSKPQKASNPHLRRLQHYPRHNDFLSGWLLIFSDQFGDFQYLIANAIIKIFWVLERLKNMMMMEVSQKVWLCKRFHLWPMLEQKNHSELRHNCKHFFVAF